MVLNVEKIERILNDFKNTENSTNVKLVLILRYDRLGIPLSKAFYYEIGSDTNNLFLRYRSGHSINYYLIDLNDLQAISYVEYPKEEIE